MASVRAWANTSPGILNRSTYLGTNPAGRAKSAALAAKHARAERSLTPAEAVARIEQPRAAEAARQAEQECTNRHDYWHTLPQNGPARGQ